MGLLRRKAKDMGSLKKEIASETGIPEEQVTQVVNSLLNHPVFLKEVAGRLPQDPTFYNHFKENLVEEMARDKELRERIINVFSDFVGRRSFLAMVGGLATSYVVGTKLAGADTVIPSYKDGTYFTNHIEPYDVIIGKEEAGNKLRVRSYDTLGKRIGDGIAGVSASSPGSDTEVVLDAVDYVENTMEKDYLSKKALISISNGVFYIKDTIKISKKIEFWGVGSKIVALTSPLFEVFDGNTSTDITGTLPWDVTFRELIIDGNNKDIFKLRYCSNWKIIGCLIDNCNRAIILERTWGQNQILFNSTISGTSIDGEGLLHVVTPVNGSTNGVCIYDCSFSQYNKNASAIRLEIQNNNYPFEFSILDTHHESSGTFISGYLISSRILGGYHRGGVSYDLDYGARLIINPLACSNMHFSQLYYSNILVNTPVDVKPEMPFIDLEKGGQNIIKLRDFYQDMNSDVSIIRIGTTGNYYYDNRVQDSIFRASACKAAIEFGDSGALWRNFVERCTFMNLNQSNKYTNCYALYGSLRNQIVRDCQFWQLNYYQVANQLSLFKFEGITKGNALFENSGTSTFSGDGTTTQFSISHGLITTPSKVVITPLSSDAASAFFITKDSTSIVVNYLAAPAAGTDNIVLEWIAKV